jgi:uncharacterized protein (DUF2062 family)
VSFFSQNKAPPRAGRTARARQILRDAWRRLRGGELRPERAAASVGVGFFVGFVPLYGVQTFICLMFTVPLRLDFPLAWATTNIANPLTAPFIIALDIELGRFLTHGHWVHVSRHDFDLSRIGALLTEALLGGAVLGTVTGLVGAAVTLVWMRRARSLRTAKAAVEQP